MEERLVVRRFGRRQEGSHDQSGRRSQDRRGEERSADLGHREQARLQPTCAVARLSATAPPFEWRSFDRSMRARSGSVSGWGYVSNTEEEEVRCERKGGRERMATAVGGTACWAVARCPHHTSSTGCPVQRRLVCNLTKSSSPVRKQKFVFGTASHCDRPCAIVFFTMSRLICDDEVDDRGAPASDQVSRPQTLGGGPEGSPGCSCLAWRPTAYWARKML